MEVLDTDIYDDGQHPESVFVLLGKKKMKYIQFGICSFHFFSGLVKYYENN